MLFMMPACVSQEARHIPTSSCMGNSEARSGFLGPAQAFSPILLPSFDAKEYACRSAKEDEVAANGGVEVTKAKAKKEPEARVEAARPEGDLQDIPLRCKLPYSIVRRLILI